PRRGERPRPARLRNAGARFTSRRSRRAGRRRRRADRIAGARSDPDPALGGRPMTATPMNQGDRVGDRRASPGETPTAGGPGPLWGPVKKFGRMIKFEHTLFALPFALAAAAIAARGHGLSIARVAGIVLAMAAARTAA